MMRDAKPKTGAKGTKRKTRIPAVVPRIVFGATFIGVIPACVAVACGGKTVDDSFSVATIGYPSVAAVGFQCPDGSVPTSSNDPTCTRYTGTSVAMIGFTVAAQIGDSGVVDGGLDTSDDAGDADAGD